MGGGGLVILPKKRWNVWNRENIERVKRDEAEAQRQAEEKQRRADEAEQEARLDSLRRQAAARRGIEYSNEDEEDDDDGYKPLTAPKSAARQDTTAIVERKRTPSPEGHINFFRELEEGKSKQGGNREAQEDKRREQEDWEKKVGILKPLGPGVKHPSDLWYTRSKGYGPVAEQSVVASAHREAALDDKDPMRSMNAMLRRKRHHDDEERRKMDRRDRDVRHNGRMPRQQHTSYDRRDIDARHDDYDQRRSSHDQRGARSQHLNAHRSRERLSDGRDDKRDKAADKELRALKRAQLQRERDERDRVAALLARAAAGGPDTPRERSRTSSTRSDRSDRKHKKKHKKKHRR